MKVSEIVGLLSNLGLGLDDGTPTEDIIYLKYVNLAYAEILRQTLIVNPSNSLVTEVVSSLDGVCSLSQTPLSIKSVYCMNTKVSLSATTLDFVLAQDPTFSQQGNPCFWYYTGNTLKIFPLYSGTFSISYLAAPPLLALSDSEERIMIPPLYHQVLADGAIYYLCQGESGFRDNLVITQAIQRWEQGKIELILFYKNLASSQSFSTYSEV